MQGAETLLLTLYLVSYVMAVVGPLLVLFLSAGQRSQGLWALMLYVGSLCAASLLWWTSVVALRALPEKQLGVSAVSALPFYAGTLIIGGIVVVWAFIRSARVPK